jgi:hypothetical protein
MMWWYIVYKVIVTLQGVVGIWDTAYHATRQACADQMTVQGVVGDGQTAERPGPLAGWQEGEQQTVQFQVERKPVLDQLIPSLSFSLQKKM